VCSCDPESVPHGSVLKCISELLMRCAPHVPATVDADGLSFVACDPATGRLIHIVLHTTDLLDFRFRRDHPLRCTLESSSLYAVFHPDVRSRWSAFTS
jgi:hypothetical protein